MNSFPDQLNSGPTVHQLEAAVRTVSSHLAPTPILQSSLTDDAFLKLEMLQPTGSFKVRGALTALSAQPPEQAVSTASAGNHGLGMAYASTVLNRKVTVVVPSTASPAKVAALKQFHNAKVLEFGESCDVAEAHALKISPDTASYISPYNHPLVIAGQATIGAEVDAQLGTRALTVVCAVGGGGLCAGLSLWASRRPDTCVVGVEVEASRPVSTAIQQNAITNVNIVPTLADGLAGNLDPSTFTWEILRDLSTPLVSVSELEVKEAMRWLFTHHGLAVEGSRAVPVAAILANKVSIDGTLVVIASGRNITAQRYAEVLGQ